jgi:hypothetical protein
MRKKNGDAQDGLPSLFETLGIDEMSDEETDEENPNQIVVTAPIWRSHALSNLLHRLDGDSKKLITRRFSTEMNVLSPVPLGLPANCYSDSWLSEYSGRQEVYDSIKPPMLQIEYPVYIES